MAKNKPYFDNNWEEYSNAPADAYMNISYDEFFDYRVGNWELPSSVKCMMRITNVKTKKVEEKIYRRTADLQKKLKAIVGDPDIEIVLCDHSSIHYLTKIEPDTEGDD